MRAPRFWEHYVIIPPKILFPNTITWEARDSAYEFFLGGGSTRILSIIRGQSQWDQKLWQYRKESRCLGRARKYGQKVGYWDSRFWTWEVGDDDKIWECGCGDIEKNAVGGEASENWEARAWRWVFCHGVAITSTKADRNWVNIGTEWWTPKSEGWFNFSREVSTGEAVTVCVRQ